MTKKWIKEYLNAFSTNEIEQIQKCFLLKDKNIPKRLFKYSKIENYILDNLRNDKLWISNPLYFNDKDDSIVNIKSDCLLNYPEEFKGIMKNQFVNEIKKSDLENIFSNENWFYNLLKYSDKKKIYNPLNVTTYFNEMFNIYDHALKAPLIYSANKCRTSCFSETNNNKLMWAHYANSSAGMCIEYDITQNNFSENLFPVVYSKEMIQYEDNFLKISKLEFIMRLHRSYITKSKEWSYEREWRMIYFFRYFDIEFNSKSKGILIDFLKPTAIYLGTATSQKDEDDLRCLAIDKNIPLFSMKPSNEKYELEINLLPIYRP